MNRQIDNNSEGLKRLIVLTATCLVTLPSAIGLCLSIHAKWGWRGLFWGTCCIISGAVIVATCILWGKKFFSRTRLVKEKRTLLSEIESKNRLLEEWEKKSKHLCDFCAELEEGDKLMNAGEHDKAIEVYENAVNKIPENFRGPQRLALLNFITGKEGIYKNPFLLFSQLALKNFTQFSVQRALLYLRKQAAHTPRGLHNISQLIYTLKITGDPYLFSLITDSKHESESDSINAARTLHNAATRIFEGLTPHYVELLDRYFELLLYPEKVDLILKRPKEELDPLDLELRETCEGCPFNLTCLYTFSDVVLHTFTLSKADAKRNVMAEELREINRKFAHMLLQIFDKYKISDRNLLRGWPSITTGEKGGDSDDPLDPYITAFILRFMSTNSGFGLRSLEEHHIINALRNIEAKQETNADAKPIKIIDGSEHREPDVELQPFGSWETRYFGNRCRSALLTIEMTEQILFLFDDMPQLKDMFDDMIRNVVRFTKTNLESRSTDNSEPSPYIVDYAAHSDYYRRYKYSDVAATAAAIRFLLLQREDVDLKAIFRSVEWLTKQQNPISGEWPVLSAHTLTTNRRSIKYDLDKRNANESLFNSVAVIEAFLSWVSYIRQQLYPPGATISEVFGREKRHNKGS